MPLRLRPEIEEEFRVWLKGAMRARKLQAHQVAWAFPFQLHPRSVEDWMYGRRRPRYPEFVGLCLVLGELPPVLRALCHDGQSGGE